MRRLLLLWALLPAVALAQSLDSLHILVDAEAVSSVPHVYKTFQEAVAHLKEGSAAHPMTVYIRPGVYWVDDPDDPTVKVGKDRREPFGMTVRCPYLHLVGMGKKTRGCRTGFPARTDAGSRGQFHHVRLLGKDFTGR